MTAHLRPRVSHTTPVTKLKTALSTPKKTRLAVVMVNFSVTKMKTSAFSLQLLLVSIQLFGVYMMPSLVYPVINEVSGVEDTCFWHSDCPAIHGMGNEKNCTDRRVRWSEAQFV